MTMIALGGGCHWCTEGVFQALAGVARVDQGYIRSDPPWDAWAEGVVVRFDADVIPLPVLIEIHLRTHSGGSGYSPGGRYRSAVYIVADDQRAVAEQAIARFAAETGQPSPTLVVPYRDFRPSDARFRDYYRSDPNRPFCRRYIDPKLDLLRARFAEHLRGE